MIRRKTVNERVNAEVDIFEGSLAKILNQIEQFIIKYGADAVVDWDHGMDNFNPIINYKRTETQKEAETRDKKEKEQNRLREIRLNNKILEATKNLEELQRQRRSLK